MEEYYKVIEHIYDFSVVTTSFPAIISLLRWRNFDLILKIFAVHTWKGAVISIGALFFYYQGLSNRPFYYIDTCLDIALVSIIASLIVRSRSFYITTFVLSAGFILIMCYDYLHDKTDKLINTQLTSLESIYVIVVTLILLRLVSLRNGTERYKKSLIWLLSALVISNLFSLLVSSLNEVVQAHSNELFRFLWYVSSPLIIILTNFILIFGYLLPPKRFGAS
ncbi:hypothetical protein [Dyadobacter sp. 32]|uniref:hypothetical protein n=1 Tax=Dyadobacter sp. 32 TaxID=538966 RepID=UPI0011EE15E3